MWCTWMLAACSAGLSWELQHTCTPHRACAHLAVPASTEQAMAAVGSAMDVQPSSSAPVIAEQLSSGCRPPPTAANAVQLVVCL